MAIPIQLKRTLTPDNPPSSLAVGEVALGLVPKIRMWVGAPTGVKEFPEPIDIVEDAADDAVYGRCDGDWVQVPMVAPTPPSDPAPNMLWFDSSTGCVYLWYDDAQWVGIGGA